MDVCKTDEVGGHVLQRNANVAKHTAIYRGTTTYATAKFDSGRGVAA